MLTRLSIHDFALLHDTDVHFKPGFTVITGETGAGKSLLVGAIAFLAGGRAAPGILRDGSRQAFVEAEFQLATGGDAATHPYSPTASPGGKGMFKSVIIRRELREDGRSRAFLDDSPVNLKDLTELCGSLVDITAQRSFSHLLNPNRHLDFLDTFAGLKRERQVLTEFERDYQTVSRKLKKLEEERDEFNRRREVLEFQLKEIEAVNPVAGEDDLLSAEIHALEHAEEFYADAQELERLLLTGDNAVEPALAAGLAALERLANLDPGLKTYIEEFETARITLKEIVRAVVKRSQSVNFEVSRLEELRERQYRLNGLARKFGGSLAAVLEKWESLKSQLSVGESTSGELERLKDELDQLTDAWGKLASDVSRKRAEASCKLEKQVVASLGELGGQKAIFKVDIAKVQDDAGLFEEDGKRWHLDGSGVDAVEFHLSMNPGVEPRPLVNVASGGELSRLLLALKEALPGGGDDTTVIFDEIDTGVSGRVAQLVGGKLRSLAEGRQLLAITHLAQIAGMADHHLEVVKFAGKQGSMTHIREIDGEDRVKALAVLLSGGKVTKEALAQAENLLDRKVY